MYRIRVSCIAAVVVACLLQAVAPLSAVPVDAYDSYLRGLLALKAGDLSSAVREYRNAVAQDENAVTLYRDLALLYWQAGMSEQALEAAGELDRHSGETLATQLFLGSFYLLAGKADRAKAAWEQALKLDPDNETAILYLAAYHSSDNNPETAIRYWNKYIEKEPNSADGYYHRGVIEQKLGQLDRAKESFMKALALKPDSPEAHIALAQLYEKEERFLVAAQEYERYMELVPDNMTVLLYLGGLYYRMKNYAAAESVFLKAGKVNPSDTTVYFWLGVLAEEKKDWDGAIRYFETLHAKEESPLVLTRLSYYYSVKKDYRKAVEYLRKTIQLEPSNAGAYFLLGLAFLDQKKPADAEKNLRRAVELKKDFEEAFFHLGVLYDQKGAFDKAVPELEKAIEINPRYAIALNYLGFSYADRNRRLDEAERLVKRALEIEPGNGSYLDSLGWVHYRQGRFAEAAQELLAASEKYSDPVIWDHLGDAQAAQNRFADAWDSYRRALDRDPGNSGIRKKVQALEKKVLPGTLQRRVLKRAMGNLMQLASLKANFTVNGQTPTINFRCLGVFHYQRPRLWRVDILGSFMAPQTILIYNRGLTVYPASLGESMSSGQRELLENVADYFASGFLADFDRDSASAEEKDGAYRYTSGDKTLVIDRRSGTVSEYRVGDALTLRFGKYRNEEGLYLPAEIEVRSRPEGVFARIALHHMSVNRPLGDAVFSLTGTAP